MEYRVGDRALSAAQFLAFVQQVWPGDYDAARTQEALRRTLNLTAYDGGQLVGCLRILTDGYFFGTITDGCYFGTITELLVLPAYQGRGIGSALLRLAREHTPTQLYFGADAFYEKNGCRRGLPAYTIEKPRL